MHRSTESRDLRLVASPRVPGDGERSPDEMRLRDYIPADAESLIEIYRGAARALGRQGYTDEQTRVWAMHPVRHGVEFLRFKMEKELANQASDGTI